MNMDTGGAKWILDPFFGLILFFEYSRYVNYKYYLVKSVIISAIFNSKFVLLNKIKKKYFHHYY